MADNEEEVRLERARRLRDRIQLLKEQAVTPESPEPSRQDTKDESPREFIHRRMAEIERQQQEKPSGS